MLALAGGSQKPTAAEIEAGQAKAQEDRKLVMDYVTKMATVNKVLGSLDKSHLQNTHCDQAAMLTKAPPGKDDYGKMKSQRIYGPYLARFAQAPDKWKKYDYNGVWDWLTDSAYGGHFETHPDKRDDYAVSDTARRVREEFLKQRWHVIIWPEDESRNRMPRWHDNTFDSGVFLGWVFVVDVNDAKVLCQSRIAVESSDEVSYRKRGLLRDKPESALKTDFEDHMKEALRAALPEQLDFGTMGSIF